MGKRFGLFALWRLRPSFLQTYDRLIPMRTQYAYLATDQQARPVGIRVVEPPADTLQVARGRLYAVIEFPDNTPTTAQRVERALSTIQRTYYTIKGTQSFVLGEALREAMQQMMVEAQPTDQPADQGILLVALLENRLMAVGAGAIVGLFTNGGKVDVFPPPELHALPLQFTETGESLFEVYRQEAPVGVAFLLAGASCLDYFSLRELASTVAYLSTGDLPTIVEALCQHATVDQLPGLFVVTAPDESRSDRKGAPVTQQQQPARRRWGGLPAALQAQLPARPLPEMGATPAAGRASSAPRPSAGETKLPADRDDSSPLAGAALTVEKQRSAFDWATALQAGVEQTKAFVAKILPERVAPGEQTPLTAAPAPMQSSRSALSPVAAPMRGGEQRSPYGSEPATTLSQQVPYTAEEYNESTVATGQSRATTLDRIATFRPPLRASGSRARLYILLALLILILTPVVVTAVYWSRDMRNQEDAGRALDMAEASFLAAESALQNGDKTTARAKLTEAQTFIVAADELVGGRLARADELSVRIEQELAELLQVQPLYALAAPLVRFAPEALPRRVLVSDQDIYVLDVGRQVVQYFQLDPTRTIVTNPEGEIVVQQGGTIDNATVGALVDITWQPPIAGVQDKAYLLVLDRNNNLFRYDRRVEGASRVALGGQDQLRTPVKMKVYADRLYMADEGANQLFRYSGDYTQPPTPWFNAQAQSDLSSLRAMDIDGDIWLLYTQGIVSRYRTGAQEPFALENSVGAIGAPVDIAVGDQGNSMVYIADSDQERILVYSKDGQYQRQFRAPEGHPLRDLQALFVDEIENTMYILTQTSLFKHPLAQAN